MTQSRPDPDDLRTRKNRCVVCGNYRMDGEPPLLHKCQRCGFESGPVVHTDECPGCEYRRRAVEPARQP